MKSLENDWVKDVNKLLSSVRKDRKDLNDKPILIDRFMELFYSVEKLLRKLCYENDILLDPRRATLGKMVFELNKLHILPVDIQMNLDYLIQKRNIFAHSKPEIITIENLEIDIKFIKSLFKWYLIEYKKGPKLSEKEALNILNGQIIEKQKFAKRIFLCYAKEDFEKVLIIYEKLKSEGYKPWMDKKDLLPGQNWELEIQKAIESADFFIACMSKTSVTKRGFVQKEIRFALDILGEIPVGEIYFIPVRLEPCEVPSTIKALHWLDLVTNEDYGRLFQSLESNIIEK